MGLSVNTFLLTMLRDRSCNAQEHTTCVTEHDKYAKGATKPGGFAAQGFYGSGEAPKAEVPAGPSGLEFLATRAPWSCSVCNVTCTSSETLMGHAAGAKHKRRVSWRIINIKLHHHYFYRLTQPTRVYLEAVPGGKIIS